MASAAAKPTVTLHENDDADADDDGNDDGGHDDYGGDDGGGGAHKYSTLSNFVIKTGRSSPSNVQQGVMFDKFFQ